MFSFTVLGGIADLVWQRYQQLTAEVARLERERRPATEFAVPPDPAFPAALPVELALEERCELFDYRKLYSPEEGGDPAFAPRGWRRGRQPAADTRSLGWFLWYEVAVELEAIAFVFTTISAWDTWHRKEQSLPERQVEERERRRLATIIRRHRRGRGVDTPEPEEFTRALERYRQLTLGWDLDVLRRSKRVKQERWAWQAWDRDLLLRLYWPRATSAERTERLRALEEVLQLHPAQLGPSISRRKPRLTRCG